MRYQVQQVVLCEVSVWGYVTADSIEQAIEYVNENMSTGDSNFDHEIISDVKTISLKIKEVE